MTKVWIAGFLGISLGWAQGPASGDSAALIEKSRQRALDYAKSLPDFLATEIVHRYAANILVDGPGGNPVDTLTIQLRYLQHHEDHKLLLINGKPTRQTFESLEGSLGSGEFGSTFSAIFDRASQTSFHRKSWKNVRGHRVAVVDYEVGPHSRYRLRTMIDGRLVGADVGYHGVLEMDAETGEVLHLEYVADHIPERLQIRHAGSTVDYTFAEIHGRSYLLPSRSQMEVSTQDTWARNVIEFREYRRFAADSNIDFDRGK